MKTIKLASGAELKITPAPFSDAKELYKSVASEMKSLQMNSTRDLDTNFIKDSFCALISSDRIEKAVEKCMERSTYKGLKIGPDTFEDEESREDYFSICKEVASVNLLPFMKSLSAEFFQVAELVARLSQK